jgi:hypothetical protein
MLSDACYVQPAAQQATFYVLFMVVCQGCYAADSAYLCQRACCVTILCPAVRSFVSLHDWSPCGVVFAPTSPHMYALYTNLVS